LTLGVWCFGAPFFGLISIFFDAGNSIAWLAQVIGAGLVLSFLLYLFVRVLEPLPSFLEWPLLLIAVPCFAGAETFFDYAVATNFDWLDAPGNQLSLAFWATATFCIYSWCFAFNAAGLKLIASLARIKEREAQLARVSAAADRAQLVALRYQINPHFMFNTLNAISGLVAAKRDEEAEEMLLQLSTFLRWSLSEEAAMFVALEDELAALDAYLNIERVRFGSRLAVETDCPDDLLDAMVPSFILQPLVENAIKHAVRPSSTTVTLFIAAAQERDALVLTVADDGRERAPAPPGLGVGLANVRERLELIYGARGSLDTELKPEGFAAKVRLPLNMRDATALPPPSAAREEQVATMR